MLDLPKFSSPEPSDEFPEPSVHNALQVYRDDLPSKTGWLEKRTTGSIKRWQWRYFVLDNKCLYYYYSDSDRQPACTINFDQVNARIDSVSEHSFKVLLPTKRLKLRGHRIRDWAMCILQHIEISDKNQINLVKHFWKYPIISNEEFVDKIKSGDLLMFTSKNSLSKIQRGLTRSKYDHVGILLKFVSGNVALFETTSQDGVSVVMWRDFLRLKWHKLYTRLIYRPLEVQDRDLFVTKLQNFVHANLGKKYKICPKKLLFKRKQSEKTDGSFFCSELIARAYQEMGILGQEKPPWKFMPGHFSEEKNLRFKNGSLGQLQLIHFND